jgi:hypothetical protein
MWLMELVAQLVVGTGGKQWAETLVEGVGFPVGQIVVGVAYRVS